MNWERIKQYIPEIVFVVVIITSFMPIEVEIGIVFCVVIIAFAFCPDKRRRFGKGLGDYSDDKIEDKTRRMIERNRQHRIEDGEKEEKDEYYFLDKDEPFYEYTQNYDDYNDKEN